MMQAGRAIRFGENYYHEGWGNVLVEEIKEVGGSHYVKFKAESETGARTLVQKFEDFLKATEGFDWDSMTPEQQREFIKNQAIS